MEHTIVPDGLAADIPAMCEAYEHQIEDWGGVDIQLLGLGHDGHIRFNEPSDHFPVMTHEVKLTEMTREANKRFFDSLEDVPTSAITMGIGTSVGGEPIIKSVGMDMVKLEKYQGFAADLASSLCLLIMTELGIPVSTTHTRTAALLGVGSAGGTSPDWSVARQVALAWLLTFPCCALLGWAAGRVFLGWL